MICERPLEAVEAAVDGRWMLKAAIWHSERAVYVRPACAVSPQKLESDGVANIFGAAHASQLFGRTQALHSSGRRIVPRPIAGYSAEPSRSQGHSVLL